MLHHAAPIGFFFRQVRYVAGIMPRKKYKMCIRDSYTGKDRWTLLVLKDMDAVRKLLPQASAATQGLDVTVLHSLVLEKIFGIDKENMAQQINLTYTRDFQEAITSVEKKESQCAFILNPTRVTEIRDVAAAGEKMPQKSTYFYPKLITGLVMNQMEKGQ